MEWVGKRWRQCDRIGNVHSLAQSLSCDKTGASF